MTKHVDKPGAFYAYIAAGFGTRFGGGAAFLAMSAYLMLSACCLTMFGTYAEKFMLNTIGLSNFPWYLGAFLAAILCAILAYNKIDLSAKVLTTVMALEIIVVMLFNLSVLYKGGPEPLSVQPFAMSSFIGTEVALGLLFSVTVFIGFEATAVFRDEVKDPEKTIPKATYLSLLLIGCFYAFCVWMLITAYGFADALKISTEDTENMFGNAVMNYLGHVGMDATRLLLVTSAFAAALSGINISSRYFFNLGGYKALPKILNKVHPKFGSPYIASMAVSILLITFLIIAVFFQYDPNTLIVGLAGVGAYSLLLLMLITSLSIVKFFKNSSALDIKKQLIPSIAAIGMSRILFKATQQIDLLIGGSKLLSIIVLFAIAVVYVYGFVAFKKVKTI